MLKELFKLAKQGAKEVYTDFHKIWTTEFRLTYVKLNGKLIQRLDIAGTGEFLDWIPNIVLLSWKGFKIGSYIAARRIYKSKHFKKYRRPELPLMITGHSKAGGTAPVFMKMYGDLTRDWCIAFNPCPTFRRYVDRVLPRTFLFINVHDLVSKAGIISFAFPIYTNYYNTKDLGNELDNHNIDQWDDFIENMKD